MDTDKTDGDKVFELEDASTTEEVLTPVVTLDSVIRQKLIDFTTPKSSLSINDVKSMRMDQILLLGKIDVHRLMTKPETNMIVVRTNAKIVNIY